MEVINKRRKLKNTIFHKFLTFQELGCGGGFEGFMSFYFRFHIIVLYLFLIRETQVA